MRYVVVAKPGAIGGPAEVFTLNAETAGDAALKVARATGIRQTFECMQHLVVMPVEKMPEGWDSGDPNRGIVTRDLDADLCGAPGL